MDVIERPVAIVESAICGTHRYNLHALCRSRLLGLRLTVSIAIAACRNSRFAVEEWLIPLVDERVHDRLGILIELHAGEVQHSRGVRVAHTAVAVDLPHIGLIFDGLRSDALRELHLQRVRRRRIQVQALGVWSKKL